MRPPVLHQWSILGSTMGNDADIARSCACSGRGAAPIVDRVFPFAEGARVGSSGWSGASSWEDRDCGSGGYLGALYPDAEAWPGETLS